jgi:phosphate transport system substrate-binding protein
MRSRTAVVVAAVAALIGIGVPAALPANASSSHAQIEGTGSSWSANAINEWVGDVQDQGLQIVFTPTGSAQGRKDYANETNDFAITDIAFQGKDEKTGEDDTPDGRPYAYLPIVAGGTSFPYNITFGGKRIDNLRLSGLTLAKIFTNQITKWSDPAITRDNNGRPLPPLPITPVVHSEGSGSSAQFTAYLAKQYPDLWGPFSPTGNKMTEYFPLKGRAIAQNGSDGVMNYISSTAGNGSIGYDEYSYPKMKVTGGWPTAKIENVAGYFTLPTDYNVAVALTQAVIDMNPRSDTYLMQKLDNVYVDRDIRAYPLSSYSYMILPTGTDAQDSRYSKGTAKRQTLADFLYYSICVGQQGVGTIGYSPLPVNLVSAGFGQIQKLKTADPGVDITKRSVASCNNPTFDPDHLNKNKLAEIAPKPPACDKAGAGPCTDATGGGGTTGGGTTGGGATTGPKAGASASASAAARIDPDTGARATAGTGAAAAQANELAASRNDGFTGVLMPLTILELAGILIGPFFVHQWLARRRREHS